MKKIAFGRLTRLLTHSKYGTFGVLKINESWLCVTLSPPDRLNKNRVSNIPTGQYYCAPFEGERWKKTWIVTNVPDRKYILFHPGNVSSHTKGCILLAEHFGKLKGDLAVLNSGNTFRKFLELMDDYDMMHLTIAEAY